MYVKGDLDPCYSPPSITIMGIVTFIYITHPSREDSVFVHALPPGATRRVLKYRVTQALSWSSSSWHIKDIHERFSTCNTNPENDLKSVRHPGHVNGRVVLSSEFKGSSDSFTSFSFELLLLRVRLVATE